MPDDRGATETATKFAEVASFIREIAFADLPSDVALQATRSGWAAHGMAGFDVPRTAAELGVPPDYRVEAAIAIGRPGDKSLLPEQLRAREEPSGRLPLSQLVREGRFDATQLH